MKTHPLAFILVGSLATFPVMAQKTDAPEEGKVYLINRVSMQHAYIYESTAGLAAGTADRTHKQYWRFTPTGEADRYYVQNVASGLYIQSTHLPQQNGTTQQVQVGTDKVPLEVKANTAAGALKGYYYLCSTDQVIDPQADNTLGLNFEQSTNRVVAYSIRYNRGNSYWRLSATDFDYEAPQPDVRSEFSKRIGVYNLPCGQGTSTFFSAIDLQGPAVTDEVHFSQAKRPTDAFVMERNDRATVVRGAEATVSYRAQKMDGSYEATVYFDWDGDGIFESSHTLGTKDAGECTFTVPDTASLRTSRFRLRLTNNGMEGAEDDVHGFCHDFFLRVTDGDAALRTLTIASCDSLRGRVAFAQTDGNEAFAGKLTCSLSRGTEVTLKAVPAGNARFLGWTCEGRTVSTQAEYTLSATQSVTLTALFSPNTDKSPTGIALPSASDQSHASLKAFNLSGQRVNPQTHHGVYVQNGKKRIRK